MSLTINFIGSLGSNLLIGQNGPYSQRTIETSALHPFRYNSHKPDTPDSCNYRFTTMSSEMASNYLYGIRIDVPNEPPDYNDVMKMSHHPTAPLLEDRVMETPFSSIFGVATSVQFEHNASCIGSFFIRDSDGSLQAKGDTNSHHIVVQNVNGMEMLKIIKRSEDQVNGSPVHVFGVVHKHVALGMIKVAENSPPRTSLQIIRGNGTPITVNSLKIGDYAVFRNKSSTTPLCNIQMPNVEVYNPTDFNIKIIFHPHTGITEEEQLLCTAAAIAFKSTIKQKVEKIDTEESVCGYIAGIICVGVVILVLVVFVLFLEKHGCETKKAKGYASYQNKIC